MTRPEDDRVIANPALAQDRWSHLDNHDELREALAASHLDMRVIQRIVRDRRLAAVDPVLDAVERTKDSHTRGRLLDLLVEVGDDVGPYLVKRLDAARADLRRELFLH